MERPFEFNEEGWREGQKYVFVIGVFHQRHGPVSNLHLIQSDQYYPVLEESGSWIFIPENLPHNNQKARTPIFKEKKVLF